MAMAMAMVMAMVMVMVMVMVCYYFHLHTHIDRVVFVVGLEEGVVPHCRSMEEAKEASTRTINRVCQPKPTHTAGKHKRTCIHGCLPY